MKDRYDIARWTDGEFRVYVENRQLYERLKRRKGCSFQGVYWYPDGSTAWDLIVSADAIDGVRKLLQSARTVQPLKSAPRSRKVPTKRVLSDNGLRGTESP